MNFFTKFLIGVIIVSCQSKFIPVNSTIENNLKGNIQSITENRYNSDSTNLINSKNLFVTEKTIFDKSGNIIERTQGDDYRVLYEYDNEGRLLNARTFIPKDTLYSELNYSYDMNGYNITCRKFTGWFSKVKNGAIVSITSFSFDSTKVLTEKINKTWNGQDTTIRKTKYFYHDKIRTKSIYTNYMAADKKLKFFGTIEQEIDSLGNVIIIKDDMGSKKESFLYKYDTYGNWIEKRFFEAEKLRYIYTRDIVYK